MNIYIDAFRLVCEKNTSGHVYVRELATSLVDQVEVQNVILIVPQEPSDDVKSYFRDESKIKFHVQLASFDPAASWWAHTRWIQFYLPKAIHGNASVGIDDYFIAPYHQVPILLRSRIKILSVIHDLCGLDAASGYKKFRKGYCKHLFNFITAINFADVLLPISDFTKQELLRYFPKCWNKVAMPAYNSVTTDTLDVHVKDKVKNELGINSGYFMAYAAMGPRKGTNLSILAYKKYKESGGSNYLLILGSKTANAYWQAYAGRENVKNIVWLSGVSDTQRDALYGMATALLFPSRCEGFGYPIVEAMRQGCSVIAWEKSPASEIVGKSIPLLLNLQVDDISAMMKKYDGNYMTSVEEKKIIINSSLRFAKSNLGADYIKAFLIGYQENKS